MKQKYEMGYSPYGVDEITSFLYQPVSTLMLSLRSNPPCSNSDPLKIDFFPSFPTRSLDCR
jgi:hypothetical protein